MAATRAGRSHTADRCVLVTDAEQRASLAAIRSLGRAGYRVVATSHVPYAIGARSRHARSVALTPSPVDHPATFARSIARLIEQERVDLVLPVTEAAHLALHEHVRWTVGGAACRLAAAPHSAFLRASDKALVRDCAEAVGLLAPAQVRLEANSPIPGAVPIPCVIKPVRSVSVGEGARLRGEVRHATSRVDLEHMVAHTDSALFPLLLQERVHGAGLGVSVLRWQGRTLAVSSHRRLQEKPVGGGISVSCETVDPPLHVLSRCERLLDSLDYTHGLAMIEFKGDNLAEPVIMEINPRLWGSVQLAIDAGVDFPRLLVEAALGQLPTAVVRSRPGVRLRWWWGSVDHALQRVRRRLDGRGQPVSGGMLHAFALLVRDRIHGAREEVWRADDPWPFVAETWNWMWRR